MGKIIKFWGIFIMSFLKTRWSISLLSLALLAGCECGMDGKGCSGSKMNMEMPDEMDIYETGAVFENGVPIASKNMAMFASGDSVYFGFDKYSINTAAQRVLEDQAAWLNAHPEKTIIIEGRCDERGTREYNLALGERRANAAKEYLMALGVDGQRISIISYGKDKPVVLGSNEQAWALNRVSTTRIEE